LGRRRRPEGFIRTAGSRERGDWKAETSQTDNEDGDEYETKSVAICPSSKVRDDFFIESMTYLGSTSALLPVMNAFLLRLSFVFVVFFQVVSGNANEPLAQKWVTRYSVSGALETMPTAVAVDASGDVYVASLVEVAFYTYRGIVPKLAGTTGATLWRWPSSFDVAIDPSITVIATCRLAVGADGHPVAGFPADVVKLTSADGSQLWRFNVPSADLFALYQLALDPSGDVPLGVSGSPNAC